MMRYRCFLFIPLMVMGIAPLHAVCADPVDFIRDGRKVRVVEASGGWQRVGGFLVGDVEGSRLIAGQQIGPGDFHIRAELVLEKMDRCAATLKLGRSYFGFVGAHGKIFLTGSLFDGATGLPIGDPAVFMKQGKPFVIEAIRTGGQLRFLIDGKLVHKRKTHRQAIGDIGLQPGRARMKLQYFAASGNLGDAFEVPLDPPYVVKRVPGVVKNRLLPPKPGNARNSEGDFIQLKDGRVLFVYSHFTGGGSDHAAGHLAGRFSSDGGRTWTKDDVVVLPQTGTFNDMSVSLLRLQNGNIALFYARKNSMLDCRPVMRISTDEARSWSEPIECIQDEIGYYVLNNDRVIQLRDGRLIMAVALHNLKSYEKPNWKGHVMCYLSDDSGTTWRRNRTVLAPVDTNGKRLIAQEPGLVELRDGRLMMFIRSDAGSQLISFSTDQGETWSTPKRSNIVSPVSPATIERIPTTGDLLLAWNDHAHVDEAHKGKRTPFKIAISNDDGSTWTSVRTLEDDANGWYCYTAMDFINGRVLLGHCAGDRRTGGLNLTQITHFPIDWLYTERSSEP
jgi:sialidase-1